MCSMRNSEVYGFLQINTLIEATDLRNTNEYCLQSFTNTSCNFFTEKRVSGPSKVLGAMLFFGFICEIRRNFHLIS